jgi:methylmalonyl-CoA/ethylmalonyl-CoA epimerase
MVIDHLGVVVRSLTEEIRRWEALFGYRRYTPIVLNTRQKVRVVFLGKKDSLMVKLIEPSAEESPIQQYARRGGGLHHVCFRCENLSGGISHLKQYGARLIVPPEPGEAFNSHDIAFLLVEPALNVELIDTTEKYEWLIPE